MTLKRARVPCLANHIVAFEYLTEQNRLPAFAKRRLYPANLEEALHRPAPYSMLARD